MYRVYVYASAGPSWATGQHPAGVTARPLSSREVDTLLNQQLTRWDHHTFACYSYYVYIIIAPDTSGRMDGVNVEWENVA